MTNWGYCAARKRIKWRCPAKCGPDSGTPCPNPFAERTAVERVNDALKNDYYAAQSRTRGRRRIFFRYALAAMRGHLEAWHKDKPINVLELIDSWIARAELAA